jgi:hypothetical protein
MKMLIDLFSTDYGLMSISVIFIVLIMAVYFTMLFLNKIKLDAPKSNNKQAGLPRCCTLSPPCAGIFWGKALPRLPIVPPCRQRRGISG